MPKKNKKSFAEIMDELIAKNLKNRNITEKDVKELFTVKNNL